MDNSNHILRQPSILIMVTIFIVFNIKVLAQSGHNYAIKSDVMAQAGLLSVSTHYQLEDCMGQPSVIGISTSNVFFLSAGYFAGIAVDAASTMNFLQGWNWISFNVQPTDFAVDHVMGGLTHLAIIVSNSGHFYIPGVVNTIGNLDITQGYKVYFNDADQITIQGIQVPSTTPIPLKIGWNFIAYFPTSPMAVETALASIISDLIIVKNDNGKFFIPGLVNTLINMNPKEGYKLYMEKEAILIYP